MAPSSQVKLNTGAYMPTVGLGTWRSEPGQVEHAVECALRSGYKSIDTATAYGNEKEVGAGIQASGVPREQIFLTTKLNNTDHKDALAALEYSLKQLNTPYLDLWLMHWPAPQFEDNKPNKSINWLDTWRQMEKVYKEHPDKVKAIGVSNVSVDFFEELLKIATVIPAVNQVELHPACHQQDVRDFCQSKGVVITSYSPLGSLDSPLLEDPTVLDLAKKHGVGPANILISLQANLPNTTVLPKSVTNGRIKANAKVVSLEADDIDRLISINKSKSFRACNPEWTGWGHLGFPDRKDI